MRAVLGVAAMLLCLALAGCGGKSVVTGGTGQPPLPPDKGAIAGLVIDDVYRPVPGALVLIESVGLTATSDGEGQFTFSGLDPGAYILKVQSDGHASAPKTVQVVAGQYAEAEVQADRLFNSGPRIVTTEYSVFMSCATSTPITTATYSCLLDQDSYRPGLSGLNFTSEQNVTYLVAEILVNQPDNYQFVLRLDDGSAFGGEQYGLADIKGGTYGKVTLKPGANYMNSTEPHNAAWPNTKPLAALLFYTGTGGDQVQSAACTVPNQNVAGTHTCSGYFGVGQKFAIQARIVLSLFLGKPPMPIDTYSTIKPSQ